VVTENLGLARVYATVIDAKGEESGGPMNRLRSDIPGCLVRFPMEPGGTGDSAASRNRDAPAGCFISIQRDWGAAPILNQGGCELVLTSEQTGSARVTVIAMGPGLQDGRDTTSVTVVPGKARKLRLRWSVKGSQCVVKIADEHNGR